MKIVCLRQVNVVIIMTIVNSDTCIFMEHHVWYCLWNGPSSYIKLF